MSNSKLVWSDRDGDLRKAKNKQENNSSPVNPETIQLSLRRLTAGKGRTVIEISSLPMDQAWCKALAKDLKKKLGVGGTYKNNLIEIHGEKLDAVQKFLDSKQIKYKKIGG